MKFSHAIQFNSVPDWAEYYVAYSNLKKVIYQIEKDFIAPVEELIKGRSSEDVNLIDTTTKANDIFLPLIEKELQKVSEFYNMKEKQFLEEFNLLREDLDQETLMKEDDLGITSASSDDGQDDEPASSSRPKVCFDLRPVSSSSSYQPLATDDQSHLIQIHDHKDLQSKSDDHLNETFDGKFSFQGQVETFRKRLKDLYINISDLLGFSKLNFTAFSKILKKYDKITGANVKNYYLEQYIRKAYPFQDQTIKRLSNNLKSIRQYYAQISGYSNEEVAVRELESFLREHIVWERNTIWRDMISMERRVTAAHPTARPATDSPDLVKPKKWKLFPILKSNSLLILSIIIFIIMLNFPIFQAVEQNNCFALLIFVSLLWASESLPLFVTSMLVPLLAVMLRVLRSDDDSHTRLTAPEATHIIFSSMFSPVIMLLLGGFTIAAALSKYNIAKTMASIVLAQAGTNPVTVLFVNMMIATFSSMLISNVAAPVLCFSLIQPILRTLPLKSPYAKCLIMGIALASNVGGMASPISSPQNVIALGNMGPEAPGWLKWFCVSIPVCIISNILIWALLLWNYQPTTFVKSIHQARFTIEKFNFKQNFIIFITILTIVLWCFESAFNDIIGDMGIIAILPLVAFFGTGILSKEDFNNFLWTVIMLAMGGVALGKSVESSGLLHQIAIMIKESVADFSLFAVLCTFCLLVLLVTTFISHTVGALIILPIVYQVGITLDDPHPRILVMGAALMCSGAMGLPISGFPNMNAALLEDETGQTYIKNVDFIFSGVPSSLMVYSIVITVGYHIMLLVNF